MFDHLQTKSDFWTVKNYSHSNTEKKHMSKILFLLINEGTGRIITVKKYFMVQRFIKSESQKNAEIDFLMDTKLVSVLGDPISIITGVTFSMGLKSTSKL